MSKKTIQNPPSGVFHPELREVVYLDVSNGTTFRIKSAADTAETIVWEDGREYPLVKVEISSASHPAFREGGIAETVAPTARSEEFRRKYAKGVGGDLH